MILDEQKLKSIMSRNLFYFFEEHKCSHSNEKESFKVTVCFTNIVKIFIRKVVFNDGHIEIESISTNFDLFKKNKKVDEELKNKIVVHLAYQYSNDLRNSLAVSQ